jgi:hypothetical protein
MFTKKLGQPDFPCQIKEKFKKELPRPLNATRVSRADFQPVK